MERMIPGVTVTDMAGMPYTPEQGLSLMELLRLIPEGMRNWSNRQRGITVESAPQAAPYGQSMATDAEKAAMAASLVDPRMRTNVEGVRPKPQINSTALAIAMRSGDPAFADFKKRLEDKAMMEAGIAEDFSKRRPKSDLRAQMEEFQKNEKLDVPNPMKSRAISDAVLTAAGRWLSSQGRDIGGGVEAGAKAFMAGRDRNEAQAEKTLERNYKRFADLLGAGEKDRNSALEDLKAEQAAALARAGVSTASLPIEMQERSDVRKINAELKKANIAAGARDRDPFAILDAYKKRVGALGQALTGEQEKAMMDAMMKQPKAEKQEPIERIKYNRGLLQQVRVNDPAILVDALEAFDRNIAQGVDSGEAYAELAKQLKAKRK